jgi:hypothetical protein
VLRELRDLNAPYAALRWSSLSLVGSDRFARPGESRWSRGGHGRARCPHWRNIRRRSDLVRTSGCPWAWPACLVADSPSMIPALAARPPRSPPCRLARAGEPGGCSGGLSPFPPGAAFIQIRGLGFAKRGRPRKKEVKVREPNGRASRSYRDQYHAVGPRLRSLWGALQDHQTLVRVALDLAPPPRIPARPAMGGPGHHHRGSSGWRLHCPGLMGV